MTRPDDTDAFDQPHTLDAVRRHRRAVALVNNIRALQNELEELLATISPEAAMVHAREKVGARVGIMNGKECMQHGTLVRRRGANYWYILLDNGRQIYRKPNHFCLLSHPDIPDP